VKNHSGRISPEIFLFLLRFKSCGQTRMKILIANSTANIAKNVVFVRTFRPSTGAIVNAKDLHR